MNLYIAGFSVEPIGHHETVSMKLLHSMFIWSLVVLLSGGARDGAAQPNQRSRPSGELGCLQFEGVQRKGMSGPSRHGDIPEFFIASKSRPVGSGYSGPDKVDRVGWEDTTKRRKPFFARARKSHIQRLRRFFGRSSPQFNWL